MRKKQLTEKEQQILDFLDSEIETKGYPPSIREICKAVGFKSTSTVHGYLEKLEKAGLIEKDPTKPRALRLVGNSSTNTEVNAKEASNYNYYGNKDLIDVPLLGKVAAGAPILAVENIEDTYPLPADLVQNSTAFMLRIQGDSMIEAGILNNDLVLVKQQSAAHNGDIVVALIDEEATVKTFYKEKDHIRLQPQNRYLDPIIVKEDITILGKVIGVFRRL
jgi:repressor LexA